MTTERLYEFYVLAGVLNYSRAAELLFLSQPALSRHIQELENELNSILFVRDKHLVRLTDEGKYLYREVGPFLKKSEQVLRLLTSPAVPAAGAVRILCSEQALVTQVLTFVQEFRERYPDIHPSLSLVPAEDDPFVQPADLYLLSAYRSEPFPDGMSFTPLIRQDTFLAYPPRHPFGNLQRIDLSMLQAETLIVPAMDSPYSPYASAARLAQRRCRGHLSLLGVASVQEGLLHVELGSGVMLIPHHLRHRIYPHTRTIAVTDPEFSFQVGILTPKGELCSPARLFYESMIGSLGEG